MPRSNNCILYKNKILQLAKNHTKLLSKNRNLVTYIYTTSLEQIEYKYENLKSTAFFCLYIYIMYHIYILNTKVISFKSLFLVPTVCKYGTVCTMLTETWTIAYMKQLKQVHHIGMSMLKIYTKDINHHREHNQNQVMGSKLLQILKDSKLTRKCFTI